MVEENTETGIDFNNRLIELKTRRDGLLYRKRVADHFSETAVIEIQKLDEEIELINQFIGAGDINSKKPLQDTYENLAVSRLNLHPGKGDKVRRGALSIKEKEELAEEREEEKKNKKEGEEQAHPNDKSRPQQPKQPGEKASPEQPIKTPEERKADIQEKLKQRDPRKQKEGLEELKKPENKGLGQDDEEFQKLIKDSGKRVQKFDKIRESIRKNLRNLMQSDSDVVKKNIAELRAGRIGSGMLGFKEIGRSTDTRFNSVARSAKQLCEDVAQLYKEFDIKPEEALSREAINEAKPLFTRQMGTKTKEDRAIDRNSRQNKYMGESKQLSEEEIEAYKRVKESYGVEADKLPPTDIKTQKDMDIVRSILRDDASKSQEKFNPILYDTGKGR